MTKVSKFFMAIALLFVAAMIERVVKAKRLELVSAMPLELTLITSSPSSAIEPETVNVTDVYWKIPPTATKGINWTFDLFTAPTIVNNEAEFNATFPWLEKNKSIIDFEIIAIERKIYPVQFLGYFNQPVVNGIEAENQMYSFLLSDVKTGEPLQIKLGQMIEHYNIEILNFTEKDPDGKLQNYPQLTVMDHLINQKMTLTHQKKYYDSLFEIRLRSKSDNREILLSHVGEEFSVGNDQYVLKAIDVENKALDLLQKIGKDTCNFSLKITNESELKK